VAGNASALGYLLLLENADCLADDPAVRVKDLTGFGIRLVGLTHMGTNRLADGNAVAHPRGITTQGRTVIRALERAGCAIDTAHLHPRCLDGLFDLFEGPLLNSHTGVRSIRDIPRNLSLQHARGIAARGGVIGITVNPEMLVETPWGRAEDAFRHLDALVQAVGSECVGLGTDFCGFDAPLSGLEDISKVGVLAELMTNHGYPMDAVEGILGGNWLRFYGEILPQ
jgi:membrane dipeptidase